MQVLVSLYEERWRSLLLTLEQATRELVRREKGTEWELDKPLPTTNVEVLRIVEAFNEGLRGKLLNYYPENGFTLGTSLVNSVNLPYQVIQTTDLKENKKPPKQTKPKTTSTGELKRKLRLDNEGAE